MLLKNEGRDGSPGLVKFDMVEKSSQELGEIMKPTFQVIETE